MNSDRAAAGGPDRVVAGARRFFRSPTSAFEAGLGPPEPASAFGHLASNPPLGHAHGAGEPEGIYRGEVLSLMGALADVGVDVRRILAYLEGEDDEEEEAEDLPDA